MDADQSPITKSDLVNFQTRLFTILQEKFTALEDQFAASEQRTAEKLAALEQRTAEKLAALERHMQQQFAAADLHMREHVETVETRLLTAFQQWAVPVNGRLRRLETVDTLANERLVMIEERLMTIEKRLGPPKEAV